MQTHVNISLTLSQAKNDKGAAGAVLDTMGLEKEKYRLSHTKVFFRAGVLVRANIDSAIADCNKVKDAHAQLSVDKNEVLNALNSGGNVDEELSTKIEKLDKNKNDLSKQVDGTRSQLRSLRGQQESQRAERWQD